MDTAQWPQEIVVKPMEEIVVVTGAAGATTNNTNTCSSTAAAAVAAGGVGAELAGAAVSHNHGQQQQLQQGSGGGEENNGGGVPNSKQTSTSMERKIRPTKDQAVNCPRCNSTNTKFCYYNNYSLTQPRYFCKTCRRYWTEGGSLRNIPVGGGSRKNKRPSALSHSSSVIATTTGSNKMSKLPDLDVSPSSGTNLLNHPSSYPNPKNFLHHHDGYHEGSQDLNLGFSTPNNSASHHQRYRGLCEFIQLPSSHMETPTMTLKTSSSPLISTMNLPHHLNPGGHRHQVSALELITGLASARGGLESFLPMTIADPNPIYSGGYPLQLQQQQNTADFKPGTLSFNLDGLGNGGGPGHGEGGYGGNLRDGMGGENANNSSSHDNTNSTGTGRLLFPFEDLKQQQQEQQQQLQRGTSATTTTSTNDRHNNSTSTDHNSSDHQHQQQHQDHSRDHHDIQGVTAGYWSGMLGTGAATGSW